MFIFEWQLCQFSGGLVFAARSLFRPSLCFFLVPAEGIQIDDISAFY